MQLKIVAPCTYINHPTQKASCNIRMITQPQNPWQQWEYKRP